MSDGETRVCPGCDREHNWSSEYCSRCKNVTYGHVPGGAQSFTGPADKEPPSWEKGTSGSHRPGGGFVPYREADGRPLGVKHYADERGTFDQIVKDLDSQRGAS